MMKNNKIFTRTVTTIIFLFALFSCWPASSSAADKVQVDILYMNHGPMRPTVAKVKKLLGDYGERIQATWYDFDSPAGQTFMQEKKIAGHVPMLIMIEGQSDFNLGDREVEFKGFPSGAGPFKRVEGNWSLDDLKQLIEQQLK